MNNFGAYNSKINDISQITCSDLENMYNLFSILNLEVTDLIHWLQKEKLLRSIFFCDKCKEDCYLGIKRSTPLGHLFIQVVLLQPWLQISHFSNLYNKIARFILPRYSKGVEPITITLYSSILSGCTGHSMMTFTHTI